MHGLGRTRPEGTLMGLGRKGHELRSNKETVAEYQVVVTGTGAGRRTEQEGVCESCVRAT